ncbi:hypothetical protein [Microbacterium sp. Leaf436]|uniref:hypothetical protein n=1 Tax=Microbacterium sp. Leaf436 TaxID=1736377 RepID=UPI0006F50B4B|nr:hypothetical protein [Microbacterium sp. Leaf436]KQT75373.1 hypothetical protein ASG45_02410 [Microbacterium sp. Leaf436]
MAVQLHYYGSVFDLDPANPDDFWVDYLHERMGAIDADDADGVRGFVVALVGDRQAHIPYEAGDRVVIVTPRTVSVGKPSEPEPTQG